MTLLRLLAIAILVGSVVACGPSKEAKDVCKRAADKYTTCVGELLGPDGAALAKSKQDDGVAECAKDDKTVAMYQACLPKTSCDEFMDCMMEYAEKTKP